jgi:hypothetical protein
VSEEGGDFVGFVEVREIGARDIGPAGGGGLDEGGGGRYMDIIKW